MYIDFEMLQNEKSPLDNFSLQKISYHSWLI